MIGQVIDGCYAGSGVYKLPGKNVLYIQTDNGEKIALSQKNAVSIEDVTAQYSANGKKVIMVLWNDFETSIIQFGGTAEQAKQQPHDNSEILRVHKQTEKHSNRKLIGMIVLCCVTLVIVIICVILYMKITENNNPDIREQNYNHANVTIEVPTTNSQERTKEDAILEAQTTALKMASDELKKKLKNPSSLVVNDATFYFPDYDEENKVMNYLAIKLDYNATNSFGGSERDEYVYYIVGIENLTFEQIMYIGKN